MPRLYSAAVRSVCVCVCSVWGQLQAMVEEGVCES